LGVYNYGFSIRLTTFFYNGFYINNMAYNRGNNRAQSREKTIACSCGGNAKLTTKKNFPFGKKSKGVTAMFYKCISCKNRSYLDGDKGGK
jgi:hypothetical protein